METEKKDIWDLMIDELTELKKRVENKIKNRNTGECPLCNNEFKLGFPYIKILKKLELNLNLNLKAIIKRYKGEIETLNSFI